MRVTRRNAEDGKVLLDVVASPEEVNNAFTMAQLNFAQQMNLRSVPGKSIGQIVSESLGISDLDSAVEAQAPECLVPLAISKMNITPAFLPNAICASTMKRGKEFRFQLSVVEKPEYQIDLSKPLEFEVEPFVPDMSHVDDKLAEMAQRYAEYLPADPHPVRAGDHCLLSLKSSMNGALIPALTTDARTYTAGAGLMPDGFDANILGMEVGESKTFTFEGPGMGADGNESTEIIMCSVTVKEIQKKVIPEFTDEWISSHMPMYKDASAYRESIEKSIVEQQRGQYDEYVRQCAAATLAKRFSGAIDDAVYEATQRNLLSNLRIQLQQQGLAFDEYVERCGGSSRFNMMMMTQVRSILIQGYSLDAVFRSQGLSIDERDIEAVCRLMNPQNPKILRKEMEQGGQGYLLRESAERMKAGSWLVDHAVIHVVRPEGQVE